MPFCKICGRVIVNPDNCSTRYRVRNRDDNWRLRDKARIRFRARLCAECDRKTTKDTPTTPKQSGITTPNTRIGGESADSPKSADFANPQDVNGDKINRGEQMQLKWKILNKLSRYEYYETLYYTDEYFKEHGKDMMHIGWEIRRIDRPLYNMKLKTGWFPMRVIWRMRK